MCWVVHFHFHWHAGPNKTQTWHQRHEKRTLLPILSVAFNLLACLRAVRNPFGSGGHQCNLSAGGSFGSNGSGPGDEHPLARSSIQPSSCQLTLPSRVLSAALCGCSLLHSASLCCPSEMLPPTSVPHATTITPGEVTPSPHTGVDGTRFRDAHVRKGQTRRLWLVPPAARRQRIPL